MPAASAPARRAALRGAAGIAGLVVVVDAATKLLATALLEGAVPLGGPLQLSVVYNDTFARGMELGALTAPANFALAALFLLLTGVVCRPLVGLDAAAPRALGLVGGAAVANALDFAHTGRGAVDFIAVATRGGAVVFNLADVAAYTGALLLARTAAVLCRAIAAERRRPAAVPLVRHVAPSAPRVADVEVARVVPLYRELPARRAPRDEAPRRPTIHELPRLEERAADRSLS